jgi:hypothetical protein
VVGGRPRTNLFAQAGSQLSAVATVMTAEEDVPGGAVRKASPLGDLFVNPLMPQFAPIQGPDPWGDPEPLGAADVPAGARQRRVAGGTLLAAWVLGGLLCGLRPRKQCGRPDGQCYRQPAFPSKTTTAAASLLPSASQTRAL